MVDTPQPPGKGTSAIGFEIQRRDRWFVPHNPLEKAQVLWVSRSRGGIEVWYPTTPWKGHKFYRFQDPVER